MYSGSIHQQATNDMGEVSRRANPQVSNPCALPCAWNVDPAACNPSIDNCQLPFGLGLSLL